MRARRDHDASPRLMSEATTFCPEDGAALVDGRQVDTCFAQMAGLTLGEDDTGASMLDEEVLKIVRGLEGDDGAADIEPEARLPA